MELAGMRNYCMGKVAVVEYRVAVGLGSVGFHEDLIYDALERISFEKKLWVWIFLNRLSV